jgi:hypothetical protein
MGDGLMRLAITQRIREGGLPHVELLPPGSPQQAMRVMAGADVGLVTLRAGVSRAAYPSKTISYLTAGCRIVAMAESDTELAAMIEEADLGRVVTPGDATSLTRAILAEADRGPCLNERSRIQNFARARFGKEEILSRWRSLYGSLVREPR